MISSVRIKDYVKSLNSLKISTELREVLDLKSTNELHEKLKSLQLLYPTANITCKTYIYYVIFKHISGSFKEKLQQLYAFSASRKTFTRSLKIVQLLFQNEYETLKANSGVESDDLLTLFIIDKLNHCEMCGKPCAGRFCSNACKSQVVAKENIKKAIQAVKDNKTLVVEKRKQTNLKKYGVENYTQTKEYKEKVKQTNLARYGVESSNQSEAVKERMRRTKLERYGVSTYNNRAKSSDTFRKNYDKEQAQLKRERQNLNRYGVIVRAWTRYKNYQNLNSNYVENNFINDDGTFKFNEFVSYYEIPYLKTAYDIKNRLGFKDVINDNHFNTKSHIEKELFDWFPASDKVSNKRSILDGFEIDIYSPSFKLGVEYDGIYWHSTANIDDPYYHVKKLNQAEERGITLFNIFEKMDNLDIWKSMIANKLGLSRRIYARKCELRRVKYAEIAEFLDANHLQGGSPSPINYALYYEDELVEVMTFKRPRFTKDYDFELLRLCTKKGITVVGGASKLFSAFRREHPTASVISYANRRWSNGAIYQTLGFTLLRASAPNYWYVRGEEIVSRYQAQKHKLPALLGEEFDERLSETENMERAGFEKLYDCGNLVFVL